jgi:zinc protease
MIKTRVINNLKRQKANPTSLARNNFNQLVYGKNHIFSTDRLGTEESVKAIKIDDIKEFYGKYFSPSIASFLIAGSVPQEKVTASLMPLASSWSSKDISFPSYPLETTTPSSKIYFIDVPGAKQSVISIGCLGLSRMDKDYFSVTVMNYKLGGSFNGNVNLVLREEKGFTYGARTSFGGSYVKGVFNAGASVRSSATLESVEIFKDLMTRYADEVTAADLDFTKNSLIKSYARQFETLGAKTGMLSEISMYQLPFNYVKGEQMLIQAMTLDQLKGLAKKYIDPNRMYYVIAGDAKTQLEPLEKIGFGKPELIIVK